jgi:hypothetical protein
MTQSGKLPGLEFEDPRQVIVKAIVEYLYDDFKQDSPKPGAVVI